MELCSKLSHSTIELDQDLMTQMQSTTRPRFNDSDAIYHKHDMKLRNGKDDVWISKGESWWPKFNPYPLDIHERS